MTVRAGLLLDRFGAPETGPTYGQIMTELSRRALLRSAVAGAALAGSLAVRVGPAAASVQNYWRYCDRCHVMFFDGYPDKGVCQAGGGHVANGYYFTLPYDVPATPNDQPYWRYCTRCHAMFFNGYTDKGACPSGGGHHAQGYQFVLPHDVAGTPSQQSDWRYCRKCHVMFFDGYEQKGLCPGGGGHWSEGYMFVLPHL